MHLGSLLGLPSLGLFLLPFLQSFSLLSREDLIYSGCGLSESFTARLNAVNIAQAGQSVSLSQK